MKSDLLDLWQTQKTNIHAILLVTHNIEEAALLADRIVIFGNDPGHVRAELPVRLPHPRNPDLPEFRHLVDSIYTLMTTGNHLKRPQPRTSLYFSLSFTGRRSF